MLIYVIILYRQTLYVLQNVDEGNDRFPAILGPVHLPGLGGGQDWEVDRRQLLHVVQTSRSLLVYFPSRLDRHPRSRRHHYPTPRQWYWLALSVHRNKNFVYFKKYS